ncbi:PREDICTED: uncharacterized protein LOC105556351 [Vollenhovia emeryi]|uniref:uncharacterized protein LOC105556351 n=1 Tax=Vollenhovia emeryi TaxID=411798 RepID=UPI0005F4BD22|nr:PREDICTED: uncharacterized protein LOC105556351 [Vollenhovia emeryi]
MCTPFFNIVSSLGNALGLAVHKLAYSFREEDFRLVAKPLLHRFLQPRSCSLRLSSVWAAQGCFARSLIFYRRRRAGSGAKVALRPIENLLLGRDTQACGPLDQVHCQGFRLVAKPLLHRFLHVYVCRKLATSQSILERPKQMKVGGSKI